jgi:putative DNA primase/helicase
VEVRFARPAFRLRFVPPIPRPEAPDKKPQRYFQPVGSAPQLYLPPRAWAARTDASVQLLGTEGEKKSAKADQEGLACFGLGGLWNWLMGGAPIEALDAIEWYSREVLLVPDARVWLKPELLFAVYALGRELVGRGASVRALKLPLGPEGAEVALDDFLCAHP